MRIIVFEDNEPVLQGITHLLRSRGHDVQGFADPTICSIYDNLACTCPREQPCADVLLTDNNMPGMTGLEFIRLQALKGCKGVVRHKAVMSAAWTAEDLRAAEKLGCKLFSKPFDLHELLNWLEECQKEIDLRDVV